MADDGSSGNRRMSKRKFVGIWAVCGFFIGVALGTPHPGPLSSMLLEKIGHGVPFALVAAILGAVVQYFFRSEDKGN
jgi:hypothetical protein